MLKLISWFKHHNELKEPVEKLEKTEIGYLRAKRVVKDGIVTTILEEVKCDDDDVRCHHVVTDYALSNLLAAGVKLDPSVLRPGRLNDADSTLSALEKINDVQQKLN